MPKINEYNRQVQSPAFVRTASPQLAKPGLAATAAAGFGEAVQNVGDKLYQRQAQSEVSDLNAKFSEARSEWATRIDDETAAGNINTQKTQEDYQAFISNMNQGISTREGREYFERQAAQLGGYVLKNSARAEAQVAGAKAVDNYMTALNTDSNLLQKRPGDFGETMQSSMEFINAQERDGALDYKNADKLRKVTGLELSKNAMRGYIRQSPHLAQKLLDKGDFDKYLDPDAKNSLHKEIQAEVTSREVQQLKMLGLKDKDPWQYLAKTGKMEGFKPIDIVNNPADSFNQRALFIDKMNQANGIDLPFVSEREADHTSKELLKLPPGEAIKVLGHLDQNVADDYKAKFAMQVFKKEPSLAAATMIAGEAPLEAQKILGGMNLLRTGDGSGKSIQAPSDAKIQASFDVYAGNAISDPGARRAAREAIGAHMVQSLFDRGQGEYNEFTDEDFKKSAEAVMGPKMDIGGMQSVSFRGKTGQFLDQDQIVDMLGSLTDKKILEIQGDAPRTMSGEPMNVAKARNRISLKSVGDGLYMMFLDGKIDQPARDKNKNPFILNLKLIDKVGNLERRVDPGQGGMGFGL